MTQLNCSTGRGGDDGVTAPERKHPAARAIPQRLFFGRQVHLRANIHKSRSRQARREGRLSILLMSLDVEMVQQAGEDRSQYEAGCDDNQKTREDRIRSRKDFSSRRFELTHWPHAR